jgi:tRNA (guanine-N7-)-methyltransferase
MPREVFEAIRSSRLTDLRTAMGAALPAPAPEFMLEIGCGNGHFLAAYAAAHPDQLCIGLDLRLERLEKAARKRDRASLGNLRFLRCDALDFLHELPAGARLHDIYMLFPDPWPKKRHHKNRLFKAALLDELAARAGPGSRLFFRTDYRPYYDEAEQVVAAHPAWHLLPSGPLPFEHLTIFQSRAAAYHSLAAAYSPPSSRKSSDN